MKQIIYELNNKKYLLVELILTSESNKEEIKNDIKKYESIGCIYRGVKDIKNAGVFSSGYIILELLVPEENVGEVSRLILST